MADAYVNQTFSTGENYGRENYNTASKPLPPKRSDITYTNSKAIQNSTSALNSRFVKMILLMITILLLLALGVSTVCMVFILQIKREQVTFAATENTSDNSLKALHYKEAEVAANSVQEAKKDMARVQETLINRTANIIIQTEELSTKVKFITSLLAPSSCRNTRMEFAKATNDTGGIFTIISPLIKGPTDVYCDLVTDEGGWIVFQRRMDGSVDFYRNWTDYVNGFGEKHGEFWLGLEYIHQMTKRQNSELRVDMTDFDGNHFHAKYSSFSVGDLSTNYQLTVSGASGNVRDSLGYHNGQAFSTKDSDHDTSDGNCATNGAWWHRSCYNSNLNGIYGKRSSDGFRWYTNPQYLYPRFSEMKFREKV